MSTLDLKPRLSWGTRALWAALDPLLPGILVEVLAQAESTNSLLCERARLDASPLRRSSRSSDGAGGLPEAEAPRGRRSDDFQPCLLVAEHQTRGRGRQGRAWQSQLGASLTFSLSLPLSPQDWSGLSLAVGVAVAEALDPAGSSAPPQIRLKWPNDLLLRDDHTPLGGRKLGGILIETVPVGERRMCVVGIGLNMRALSVQDASCGAAGLQELIPEISAPATLARVAPALVRALQMFENRGFAPFAARYEQRDILTGRSVHASLGDGVDGVVEGVDPRGALRLVSPDGRRLIINSGAVSVRAFGGSAP